MDGGAPAFTYAGRRYQGGDGAAQAHHACARAFRRTAAQCVRRQRRHADGRSDGGGASVGGLVRLRGRRRAALDPVLGHAAPARQQLRRARAGRACRRCCTSTTRRSSTAARSSAPVNYALVRIVPPEGVTVDPKRRPYVIIDPRAGHGPGIGGFKDDSQVGVALRAGHPVYFVIFFRDPEPGQTLLDVCEAEKQFVHKVRELHPQSAEARDRRQLPGRLGGDDARRRRSRRHRPDRDQRRADVVLGRRLAGGRGRQPDALRRRPARRHLARLARRPTSATACSTARTWSELREPESRPTRSGTSTTTCSRTSTPSRRASSSSSAGGAAST